MPQVISDEELDRIAGGLDTTPETFTVTEHGITARSIVERYQLDESSFLRLNFGRIKSADAELPIGMELRLRG